MQQKVRKWLSATSTVGVLKECDGANTNLVDFVINGVPRSVPFTHAPAAVEADASQHTTVVVAGAVRQHDNVAIGPQDRATMPVPVGHAAGDGAESASAIDRFEECSLLVVRHWVARFAHHLFGILAGSDQPLDPSELENMTGVVGIDGQGRFMRVQVGIDVRRVTP